MLLIESQYDEGIRELTSALPTESFSIIKPKYLDGSQIVQVIIDLAKVAVPAAIGAISTYLATVRSKPTIKIKFSDKNGLEAEIEGKLTDEALQKSELSQALMQLILKEAGDKLDHEHLD